MATCYPEEATSDERGDSGSKRRRPQSLPNECSVKRTRTTTAKVNKLTPEWFQHGVKRLNLKDYQIMQPILEANVDHQSDVERELNSDEAMGCRRDYYREDAIVDIDNANAMEIDETMDHEE